MASTAHRIDFKLQNIHIPTTKPTRSEMFQNVYAIQFLRIKHTGFQMLKRPGSDAIPKPGLSTKRCYE